MVVLYDNPDSESKSRVECKHPDSKRSTMNSPNPREDRFAAILRLRWTILESKAMLRVSQRIRYRVDVSQIVNDAAHEWIQRVGELERVTQPKQLSDERLIGLLMKIVEKRSLDAIRDVNAWKRGGRIEAVGSDHFNIATTLIASTAFPKCKLRKCVRCWTFIWTACSSKCLSYVAMAIPRSRLLNECESLWHRCRE